VWEPVPGVCTPGDMETCIKALKLVDVVSPNHAELASFFGGTGQKGDAVDVEAVEAYAKTWLNSGIGHLASGSAVIRCGKEGCLVASRTTTRWLPAYHQAGSAKVVDPTGGGNCFLGALALALSRGHGVETAAMWGSIAASFAIEQIGLPTMRQPGGQEAWEGETWNGEHVQTRLHQFVQGL
jgi:sugar/nucleoside kinase (ribokinase family)